MDRQTAIGMWQLLETERATDCPGDPPKFDVRLDARSGRDDPPPMSAHDPPMGRYYALRVTAARGYMLEPDDLMYVAELAREREVSVELENNGVAIY